MVKKTAPVITRNHQLDRSLWLLDIIYFLKYLNY